MSRHITHVTPQRTVIRAEMKKYLGLYHPAKVSSVNYRRRVSSVVEHSSANPKVHGSIPGPVSYRGHGL